MAKNDIVVLKRGLPLAEQKLAQHIRGELVRQLEQMQAVALVAQAAMEETSTIHRRALWEIANTASFTHLVKKLVAEELTDSEKEAWELLNGLYLKCMDRLTKDAGEKIVTLAKEDRSSVDDRGFLARLFGE